MLQIQNLKIQTDTQIILENFSLSLAKPGIYGLTGPNGSGKSSLAKAIMGLSNCQISGQIILKTGFDNTKLLSQNLQSKSQVWNLTELTIWQRARLGLFLAFQNPPVVKGVSTLNLLKAALDNQDAETLQPLIPEIESDSSFQSSRQILNNSAKFQPSPQINDSTQNPKAKRTAAQILTLIKTWSEKLQIGNLYRQKLENLSGGERKKLEILQLLCLEPKLAILDEIDSGLDQASIRLVAQVLIDYCQSHKQSQLLVISHNPQFLELLQPIEIFDLDKLNPA